MHSSRRSKIVALTLVGLPMGALTLATIIPPEQEMRRNLYTDRAACERDYTAEQCAPRTSTSGGSHGSYWHGPFYAASPASLRASGDPGAGRTGQISPTETSTRGGFGSFGRAMGAVG